MRVIEKLLEQVDAQTLKDYESQSHLHLKQVLTTISKHRLEDMTQVNVLRQSCRSESCNVSPIATITSVKAFRRIGTSWCKKCRSYAVVSRNADWNWNRYRSFWTISISTQSGSLQAAARAALRGLLKIKMPVCGSAIIDLTVDTRNTGLTNVRMFRQDIKFDIFALIN